VSGNPRVAVLLHDLATEVYSPISQLASAMAEAL
jgi:hypothetical protein